MLGRIQRLAAILCILGWIGCGGDKSTTPGDTTAPASVTDLACIDSSSTSITLAWTAPGDDSLTGTASAYDIRYFTSPITETNWDSATQVGSPPAPAEAEESESLTVAGLTKGTTYYFAVKTRDDAGNWSGLSNVAVATAIDLTPPAAIDDLTITGQTESAMNLSWTAPGDNGTGGTASQYDLRYATATITEGNWDAATQVAGLPAPHPSGSAESFAVTGLTFGETYYFALKTAD
ncbi:MAG TPA: fibronectin type III domain-containing protein, partial [candidate division Zixibacteria bacterium]|nr:fibronectin type III domain-containing protein [candidate division Zixibacteria bacterium]